MGWGGIERSLASTRLSLRTREPTGGVGSGREACEACEACAAPSVLLEERGGGLLLISEQVGHVWYPTGKGVPDRCCPPWAKDGLRSGAVRATWSMPRGGQSSSTLLLLDPEEGKEKRESTSLTLLSDDGA